MCGQPFVRDETLQSPFGEKDAGDAGVLAGVEVDERGFRQWAQVLEGDDRQTFGLRRSHTANGQRSTAYHRFWSSRIRVRRLRLGSKARPGCWCRQDPRQYGGDNEEESMERHSIYEVFTPTTQARLNFVGRAKVNDSLVDALRTPGKQVVVYGESGSGKSTLLLKKLEELYPAHITTRCSASSNFTNILLDAFDQLDQYYVDVRSHKTTKNAGVNLGGQFLAIKAAIATQVSKENANQSKRILPPQLTPQRLGEFIGAQHLCWVLEDFHKVPLSEKTMLAQTLKIFSDLARDFPDLRIVAVGATDTAREVVQYDREMRNRVAEINVPLMDEGELRSIIVNGSRLLNVSSLLVANDIVSFSSGLASVTHHLALNACMAAGVVETTPTLTKLKETDLESAVAQYISESSDTLKALFDVALVRKRERRYDNTRLILGALASGRVEGMSTGAIRAHIQQTQPDYPAGNLTTYLRKLTTDERGGIVRLTANGAYRFSDPIVHSYARVALGIKGGDHWSIEFGRILSATIGKLLHFDSHSTSTKTWLEMAESSESVEGELGGDSN
jgi:GTPase SAR1 family protein